MSVDPIRHLEVFDPYAFGERRVDVIGAGALGSKVVLSLAKLGITNIHVWDFDKVEEHNIANQAFGIKDIGKPKVKALQELVKRDTGTVINIHEERVDGKQPLGEIVICLPDSMEARKAIWMGAAKFKPSVKVWIEARMGTDNGRIYAIDPLDLGQINQYEKTFYGDDEAEVSACGATISVGPTADIMCGMVVWQVIRFWGFQTGKAGGDAKESEIVIGFRPCMFLTRDLGVLVVPKAAVDAPVAARKTAAKKRKIA